MGMGRDNSLPDTSTCPILLAPSGGLWAGGGDSPMSSIMFCFAFVGYFIHIPFPQSQSPEFLSSVVIYPKKVVITQNKAVHNSPSLYAPELQCHSTFALCKPQVFSLKSCKKWKELGYWKSFRQNLLVVLISCLNICDLLLHKKFRPNFTFEAALSYMTKSAKYVFSPLTLKSLQHT